MHLFDFLKLQEPLFDSSRAKIHFARHNGVDAPIDVYMRGDFDESQRWQTRKNFSREFVVSLVRSHQDVTRWLFVGLFKPIGLEVHLEADKPHYLYYLDRVPSTREFEGRLFVRSIYKQPQTYMNGETVADALSIEELLRESA